MVVVSVGRRLSFYEISAVVQWAVSSSHDADTPVLPPSEKAQFFLAINLRVGYYEDMKKLRIPEHVMEYFRKTGAMGGKARATKHSPDELSKWGKMGGRPKGSGKKPKKGGK